MKHKFISLWLSFALFGFCYWTVEISLGVLLSIWSFILALYLLIKNKLPSKKHILISLILTILVSISYIGLNTEPSTILLNSVFSGISTLFCSLAVFSVMEKNTDIKFIERNKIGSTIIIAITIGVILSVFNSLLMMGNTPVDFEISVWRLLACLNPAIFEEMSGRAIFMAYCLYKIGNEKPSKFCSFTMIFMMSVPHTFSHGYGVIETLVLLVLFGLPLTVLQRKRGITSAMISHGTIDAIRFTIWGLVL